MGKIKEAKSIAKKIDNADDSITLRLRNLSGLIKLAGDIAVTNNSKLIEAEYIKSALKHSKSIEEQINDKYGSMWKAGLSDYAIGSKNPGSETV